jgi:hypothetical protein
MPSVDDVPVLNVDRKAPSIAKPMQLSLEKMLAASRSCAARRHFLEEPLEIPE